MVSSILGQVPPSRNPPWVRDELILALGLYFRHPPASVSQSHEAVLELSDVLNRFRAGTHLARTEEFPNPNGVYMELYNFLRFDDSYKGVGLTRGGHLEQIVWKEFSQDKEHLQEVAQAIRRGIEVPVPPETEFGDVGEEFAEGQVLWRWHQARERSQKLISVGKERARRHGALQCEACGFDFEKAYGEIGSGFMECHHLLPLASYGLKQTTRLDDVVLVCANCHRMLHRLRPWLTRDRLDDLLVAPS